MTKLPSLTVQYSCHMKGSLLKTAIIRMSRPEFVFFYNAKEEKITKISLLQPVNVKYLVNYTSNKISLSILTCLYA